MQLGAEQYGVTAFLNPDNDLFNMIQEEVLDIANYCAMMYVRIQLMKERFDAAGLNSADPVAGNNQQPPLPFGASAFVSTLSEVQGDVH